MSVSVPARGGGALGIKPPTNFWVQKQRKEDASLVLMTPSAGEQEAKLTPVGPITILGQLFRPIYRSIGAYMF